VQLPNGVHSTHSRTCPAGTAASSLHLAAPSVSPPHWHRRTHPRLLLPRSLPTTCSPADKEVLLDEEWRGTYEANKLSGTSSALAIMGDWLVTMTNAVQVGSVGRVPRRGVAAGALCCAVRAMC